LEIDILTSNDKSNDVVLRNFKDILEQFKKRVKILRENLSMEKKYDSIIISEKENQHERLIKNEKLSWNQYEKIEKAKRTAFEMENISIDIAKDLILQTENIKSVKGKIMDLNQEISTSNTLITKMVSREYKNKRLLFMFIVAFVLIFLAIVYFKICESSSEPEITIYGKEKDIPVSQTKFFNSS